MGGYVFQRIADNNQIDVPISYLFLTPIVIILPGLSMLRAHRKNIYRLGTFVKVFLESSPHGAQWHEGLAEFRSADSGESLDHVPLTIWMLTALSVSLFYMALVVSNADHVHWLAPVPLLILLGIGHKDFADAKNASAPEAEWHRVRAKLLQRSAGGITSPLPPTDPEGRG